eukprot:12769209-Alexandrium_andersonii.AAC.1
MDATTSGAGIFGTYCAVLTSRAMRVPRVGKNFSGSATAGPPAGVAATKPRKAVYSTSLTSRRERQHASTLRSAAVAVAVCRLSRLSPGVSVSVCLRLSPSVS